MIKNFNNLLALILLVGIFPALWILAGLSIINLNGEVLGATIAGFTLVLQFYFRKKEGE